MDYNTDKPIHAAEDDLLGRASFSQQLGKAIYEYNGKDGLVIGLFGKWGTGKTSVINIAENEILKFSEKDENKPIIMRFAPWNYSDKDNLISLFFQSLKNKIDVQDNEQLKKKVGKALSDYSGAFDAFSIIPLVGSGVAAILKTIAQAKGANLMQNIDLDQARENLERALVDANKKIIIVIDDIDRLTNSQIRDIFQLVKQVADFPNVIYVLAMDRDVVRSALTEVHNIDGNEYLEKIIQIPFELPALRKSKLHDIFFSKLGQVIDTLPDKVEWDESYWNNVFRNCIEPFIYTLRDINRVINTFQFRYGLVYQETSFEDMIAITTLEVLEPELYKWIASNREAVCGGFAYSFSSSNKLDYRKFYHDEFERLGINPDLAISCVSTLFPVFANAVKGYQYGYHFYSDVRGKMRAREEGRFELYFMFDLDDIKVSRNTVNKCIHEFDSTELKDVILKINEEGNIAYFIEELESLVDEIPYNRLTILASVIINLQGEFKGEEQKVFFRMSTKSKTEYLVYDIIDRLEAEEEKFSLICSAVKNMDEFSAGFLATIINKIELAYGRLVGNSEKPENQLITLPHLEEIEKIYANRISEIANSVSLLNMSEINIVFYLWQSFDKDGAKVYLDELFKNVVNQLKFICGLAGRWTGTHGNGWSFYTKHYSEYISPDEIYNLIQSFDKKKLDEFTEIEQIKLASFVLNHHKGDMGHANEQEAMELVNRWKTDIY